MILCDIGNSFYHFYKDGAIWREPVSSTPVVSESETIYTVSVNPSALFRLASKNRVGESVRKTLVLQHYKKIVKIF